MADNDDLAATLSRMLQTARNDYWMDNRCSLAAHALVTRVQEGDFAELSGDLRTPNTGQRIELPENAWQEMYDALAGTPSNDEDDLPLDHIQADAAMAVVQGWIGTAAAQAPAASDSSDREYDECYECETTGYNCTAHGGRPGIPYRPAASEGA